MSERWEEVCRLEDIVPNTGVCALVGAGQVAVFRLDDDSLYALDNRDPFSGANVLSRGIVGDLKGELVVASPVYKQHFSLATGQCLEDPEVRVATHAVRLEGDVVRVAAPEAAAVTPLRPPTPAAKPRLVIAGNGMAGVRALEELLKLAPDRYEIIVFGAEPHGNYNRILLSPVLAGEKTLADIMTHTPQWYAERGTTLHAGDPVVRIDRARCEVVSRSGRVVPYDRLLLATGSKPFRIPLPGADLPGVTVFREIADVEAMLEASRRSGRAVVIGGGLLGLEAAYGLKRRGMDVTVVHLVDRLMDRQLDAAAAALLRAHLEASGIRVLLKAQSQAILGAERERDGRPRARGLLLKDGRELPADLIVMAAGVVPNCELAKSAGLSCERGILVDDTLQTYDPRIYAVGECVQHRKTTYGLVAPLWEQARVCANHLAGHGIGSYRGSVLATRLKVTGIELFSAGDFAGGEGTREVVYDDAKRGIYKRLVLREDRLVGAVLYGDAADGGWYLDLIRSGSLVSAYGERLVFGQRYAAQAA